MLKNCHFLVSEALRGRHTESPDEAKTKQVRTPTRETNNSGCVDEEQTQQNNQTATRRAQTAEAKTKQSGPPHGEPRRKTQRPRTQSSDARRRDQR
ncbi:hypothetical protein PHYSODRAFT_323447 [Phytophthora sojae]|uniref:Uncharacterized protein n=1 Tax=Phytophthora sojae (strain P6497) TaxID=1094619 RepID=G4YL89_PHYSP|nr:hypothetical protein PHYSODRAFT_323447 [Phytophthora sojae]EGZ30004.1 hypothetical protein PHYSODRAFT_323447 [Phytophthora sojae]|eukprot:XP_009517279.1 hypothetical protein PHYSODRAFT_323447 [Phytophthora sojae]